MPTPTSSPMPRSPRYKRSTMCTSILRPARFAQGTQKAEQRPTPPTRFARSESSADEMRLDAIRFMLDSEETGVDTRISQHGGETRLYPIAAESQPDSDDWDDHTLVEIELFLPTAW